MTQTWTRQIIVQRLERHQKNLNKIKRYMESYLDDTGCLPTKMMKTLKKEVQEINQLNRQVQLGRDSLFNFENHLVHAPVYDIVNGKGKKRKRKALSPFARSIMEG